MVVEVVEKGEDRRVSEVGVGVVIIIVELGDTLYRCVNLFLLHYPH